MTDNVDVDQYLNLIIGSCRASLETFMASVSINIDDDTYRQLELVAAKCQKTINSLVCDYFAHLIASGLLDSESMNGNLQTLFAYAVGNMGRREARVQLGVDDLTLTQMLRHAGFPPPRASDDQEEVMLAEIAGIHLGK